MNLNEFQKLLKKNIKKLITFPLVFGLFFGLISNFFPKSFVTEGTFIIIPEFKKIDSSNDKNAYNYDGYYIDQISQSYSKTITGIIETPEFKRKVSSELGYESSFQNILLLNLKSNFKEIAPRVLVLSVRSNSKDSSEKMFSVYEKEILNLTEKYNSNKIFKIERLVSEVNTFENSIPNYLYFFISFSFVFVVMLVIYFLKEVKNER